MFYQPERARPSPKAGRLITQCFLRPQESPKQERRGSWERAQRVKGLPRKWEARGHIPPTPVHTWTVGRLDKGPMTLVLRWGKVATYPSQITVLRKRYRLR